MDRYPFFEHYIMERLSKWLPINAQLNRLKDFILRRGRWGIFLGRLLPYLRGYVSVAAGVLNIPYKVFLPAVIFPALLWTGGYVTAGHFIGSQWRKVGEFISGYQWIILAIVVLVVVGWLYWRNKKKQSVNNPPAE